MKLTFFFALLLPVALTGCGSSPSTTTQTPAGDFAIQVSSQSAFVPIGFSSSSVQVSIVPTSGFSQPVSISVTGLPQGVTTTPAAPFTINAGSSQTVVFNAASNATANLQQVSLVATSGRSNAHQHSVGIGCATGLRICLKSVRVHQPTHNKHPGHLWICNRRKYRCDNIHRKSIYRTL